MKLSKIKKQFFAALLLSGFFIPILKAAIPLIFYTGSLLVHVVAGYLIFSSAPTSSDITSPLSQLNIKVPPLTQSELDSQSTSGSTSPSVKARAWTYNSNSIYFSQTLGSVMGTSIGISCQDIADSVNYTGAVSINYEGTWQTSCKDDQGKDFSILWNTDSSFSECGDPNHIDINNSCVTPPEPVDNIPTKVIQPDGIIVDHSNDIDSDTSAVTCLGNSCSASAPSSSGGSVGGVAQPPSGTTTSEVQTSPDSYCFYNETTNQTFVNPSGVIDINVTVKDKACLKYNGELISKTKSYHWSDGTVTTYTGALNPPSTDIPTDGNTTGSGTTKIDETGTPVNTDGYGDGDFSPVDSFMQGLDVPENSASILKPSTTFSLGGTGACSENPSWTFNYHGYGGSILLCEYIGYISSFLYWFFASLTFMYVYSSYASINRAH